MLFFFAFFHCVFKKEEMAKYLSHRIIGSSSEGEKKQQKEKKEGVEIMVNNSSPEK